jgi:DNA invertase Pin-like site-specific DNA recombinase
LKAMTYRKAYLYLGKPYVSEQAREDAQRQYIEKSRRYTEDHGLDLDKSYLDGGVSAVHDPNFDPLTRFLAAVKSGSVSSGSYLLIKSFDRLSRQTPSATLDLIMQLTQHVISIVTLADGQTFNAEQLRSTPIALYALIDVLQADEQSRRRSQLAAYAADKKRRLARDQKLPITAQCPGWFKLVGGPNHGRFETIPERASIGRRSGWSKTVVPHSVRVSREPSGQ